MAGPLVARLSQFSIALTLCLVSFGVIRHAQADDPHVTFFIEGVLGGEEETAHPLILLPSPQLNLAFYRPADSQMSEAEIAALAGETKSLAGSINFFASIVSLYGQPFVHRAAEDLRVFAPEALGQSQMAIVFMDATTEEGRVRSLLDDAYQRIRQSHPDVATDVAAALNCGIFVFRTPRQVISSIVVVPPDTDKEPMFYCLSTAILETVGFRGRVSSLSDASCESVRCSRRPKTSISTWDAMAIAALYSVDNPKPVTALYRFKEIFRAGPQSSQ
jgi:hypothetical protein